MKKTLLFAIVSLLLVFVSCNKDADINSYKQTNEDGVTLHALKRVNPKTKGVANTDVLWENGQTIRIKFLNGTTAQHNLVKQHSAEWLDYANLKFEFVAGGDADVKIGFNWKGDNVSWSYYGNEAKGVKQTQVSSNFGSLPTFGLKARPIILRMFGHILGLLPEHNNANSPIQWDKDLVYQYYESEDAEYWTKDVVDEFFFSNFENTEQTDFDANSIMVWPIDDFLTLNGVGYTANNNLSDKDKEFIAQLYPNKYKIMVYRASAGFRNNDYQPLIERALIEKPDILVSHVILGSDKRRMCEDLDMKLYYEDYERPTNIPGSKDSVLTGVFLRKDLNVIRTGYNYLKLESQREKISNTLLYMIELDDAFLCTAITASGDVLAYENLNLINKQIDSFTNGSKKPVILNAYLGAWYNPNGYNGADVITPGNLLEKYEENWNSVNVHTYHGASSYELRDYVNMFVLVKKPTNPTIIKSEKMPLKPMANQNGAVLISEFAL